MNKIGNSELIYNPDGSIYHLKLKAENIADTIFLVGDPNRVDRVSKHFDSIEFKIAKREFFTHTGYVGKKRVTVISTGIGTDNIDIVINELDAIVNIDQETRTVKKDIKKLQFIRLGTSGTLDADIAIDSIVASKMALGMDILMHYYNYDKNSQEVAFDKKLAKAFPGLHPYSLYASPLLLEKLSKDIKQGITVTAAGFYGPQGRQLRASNKYPDLLDQLNKINHDGYKVTNFEMESSGIYGLSRSLGHEALSFNTIIANRALRSFSSDPKKAVDDMIVKILPRIEQM